MKHLAGTSQHTHADRLERWLGAEAVARVSEAARKFYWPVALHGVPGRVFVMPGGDFCGEIRAGAEASAVDRAVDTVRRHRRAERARTAQLRSLQFGNRATRRAAGETQNAYADLSALIAAATGGKAQYPLFNKVGTTGIVATASSLWNVGNQPAAASAASAAPGGNAPTSATAGALEWNNPSSANTGHFISGWVTANVIANTLLLYDRLFHVAKTASSSTTEAVTGTFSRYQSGTGTAEDYIGGNFVFPEIRATIANTAHNWTVCQYTDQDSNATQSIPSIAGIAAATNVNCVDLAAGNWFMPLASGDVGVKALTQMQCSSAAITGTVQFVVGHPIAFLPCPVANMVCVLDGVNTAFNMTRVYDDACLALLEMPKPATNATTYSGQFVLCSE